MGLPVHLLNGKYRSTWVDTLRSELSGYATVETLRESENDLATVYIVGDHGHFTLEPLEYDGGILILMWPFDCSVKRDGRDMYNLEERIHRVLDSMSVAFEPEEIEKYEKSRWTKFYRLFGWEHVGSLDFAHRKKREIIEDGDDPPRETKQREFHPEYYARCKPEYETTWPEIFRERLRGKADVLFANDSPHIVSPNGKNSMTVIRIKHGDAALEVCGETQNDVCWIDSPFYCAESAIRTPLHWATFKIFREITENGSHFESQNETSEPHSIKKRFYGKTLPLWSGVLVSVPFSVSAILGVLSSIGVIEPHPVSAFGIFITIFGPFFLLMTVLLLRDLWIRQKPLIRLYQEGIEVLDLSAIEPVKCNFLQIMAKAFRVPVVRLRWEETEIVLHENVLGIFHTPDENVLSHQAFIYSTETLALSIKKVWNILRYFRDDPQARWQLPDWKK